MQFNPGCVNKRFSSFFWIPKSEKTEGRRQRIPFGGPIWYVASLFPLPVFSTQSFFFPLFFWGVRMRQVLVATHGISVEACGIFSLQRVVCWDSL